MSPTPEHHLHTRLQSGVKTMLVSIVINSLLAAVKLVVGVVGNAYALIADGIESTLDVFSSAIVWGGLRYAAQPPDKKHPFGHGKAESLAGLVVSIVLIAAAIGIAVESIREIMLPHHAPASYTLIVLVAVMIIKEVLARVVLNKGEALNSIALKADAWHHRSDALTSLAAFTGISIALFAGPGYESADDWAALVASGIITFNGYRMFREVLHEIMDGAPPSNMEEQVRNVAGNVDHVAAVEKCLIRKSGPNYFVEIHIEVDGKLSVFDGHEIAHQVKDALITARIGIWDVAVHVEPYPHQHRTESAST